MPSEKTEKKKSETTSEYVTTIRSDIQPAIGANIFRLIYPDKAPELYFKVKRAYTLDDGETFKTHRPDVWRQCRGHGRSGSACRCLD